MGQKLLAITLGDPLSISIECLQAIGISRCENIGLLVIGSFWQWQWQSQRCGNTMLEWDKVTCSNPFIESNHDLVGKRVFWDVGSHELSQDPTLVAPHKRGELARRSLEALKAIPECLELAVLTCPIDKGCMKAAGWAYPGQTEFFTAIWAGQSIMVLSGPQLRVGLVTNHLALVDVAQALSAQLVVTKIQLLAAYLQSCGIVKPRLGVLGLNPHCSDGGLFGDEEAQVIAPALEEAKSLLGDDVELFGPLPADTAFFHAIEGGYDAILAMYHDQGLGPLKTVHFYDAINTTFGLKHLRVSPDHGPAQDLFLTGKARSDSFREAYGMCLRYLQQEQSS